MSAKSQWGFSESVFLEPSNSDFRKLDLSIEVRSWRVEWERPERQRGPGGKAAGRGGHASPPPATDHHCPETRITRMQPQDATSDRLSAVIVRLSTEKLYLITRVMQWAFLCVFFFFKGKIVYAIEGGPVPDQAGGVATNRGGRASSKKREV